MIWNYLEASLNWESFANYCMKCASNGLIHLKIEKKVFKAENVRIQENVTSADFSKSLGLGQHTFTQQFKQNRTCLPSSLVAQWQRICLQCRRCKFNLWFGKVPWKRKLQPTPVFLHGKSHGQKSLVGYSLWGFKESETTEEWNNIIKAKTHRNTWLFAAPLPASIPLKTEGTAHVSEVRSWWLLPHASRSSLVLRIKVLLRKTDINKYLMFKWLWRNRVCLCQSLPTPHFFRVTWGIWEVGIFLLLSINSLAAPGRSLCVISDISQGKQIRVFPYFVSQHPQATP